jgi:hypothetical protein
MQNYYKQCKNLPYCIWINPLFIKAYNLLQLKHPQNTKITAKVSNNVRTDHDIAENHGQMQPMQPKSTKHGHKHDTDTLRHWKNKNWM